MESIISMLSNLPEELILEILSRIPMKDVCRCKSVCGSWQKLIETPEFARSHLSKSVEVPGLLINLAMKERMVHKVLECSRSLTELDDVSINQDQQTRIQGSVNGLVLFRKAEEFYVCNPITREFVKLPRPPRPHKKYPYALPYYGFGVSSKSGQYKVVRMLDGTCQVYTLGGRNKWRRIIAPSPSYCQMSEYSDQVQFLNGNLHWLVIGDDDSCSDDDSEGWWVVSCLDLETEAFSEFRAPTLESSEGSFGCGLGVLRGCLCLCDDESDTEYVVYTMSCYQRKTWVKECVIRKTPDVSGYPVMVFGDSNGGVLMVLKGSHLFCYSNTTKERIDFNSFHQDDYCGGGDFYVQAFFYTPSFVSLGDSFKTRVIKYY